jgi:class 3 adenylate cyclase
MEERLGSINILAVYDTPLNIKSLKTILEPLGYNINGAASCADALKFIDRSVPDIILLDVMAPDMNGLETCRRIREKKELPYIPIIFITAGEPDLPKAVEGLDAGGDDFIRKPFQAVELISRIRANLRVKSAHDRLSEFKAELSRHVSLSTIRMVENLVMHDKGLQNRKANVTVMFSDIRGFTQLAADADPESVFEKLNGSIKKQIQVIEGFHGVIDKLTGDEVMAIFEGPQMADNAIQCALQIVRELSPDKSLDNSWSSVGIGINTGPVFIGSLGTESARDFTVIGNTVNIAARLCGLAERFQIICTKTTIDSIQDNRFKFESMGAKMLKGLSGPIELFRPISKRAGVDIHRQR